MRMAGQPANTNYYRQVSERGREVLSSKRRDGEKELVRKGESMRVCTQCAEE